jgi:hypothetical protein
MVGKGSDKDCRTGFGAHYLKMNLVSLSVIATLC